MCGLLCLLVCSIEYEMTFLFITKEVEQFIKKRKEKGKKAIEKANVLSYDLFDAEMNMHIERRINID